MKNKYYEQIDTALKSYETLKPWHPFPLEWIGDRIAWCWKWRKISEVEMTELVNRYVDVMEVK